MNFDRNKNIFQKTMITRLSKLLQYSFSSIKLPKIHKDIRCLFQKNVCFLFSLPFATLSAAKADEKPFEPNDVRLRSSECLKNAAGLSVDSTSAVLSQTVYSVINIEKQYIELLNALTILLEYQVQILGQDAEEQRIADIILKARYEINEIKRRKNDLALLFSSVEKLADATAEVAFATGSEYASTCAGERLYSAQQEVKKVLKLSEEAEKQLIQAELEMIQIFTQHEEKKAKKLKEEDANTDLTETDPDYDKEEETHQNNEDTHENKQDDEDL